MAMVSNLENLTDFQLHLRTVEVAKKEQQTTLELLHHLHEVDRRKLYAQRGYGSLWEYVVSALSYSESQASERLAAMRLMFRVKEAQEALENGKLGLTQAAMAERHLRAEEKEIHKSASPQMAKDLILRIEGKSKKETERLLVSLRPEEPRREQIRAISSQETEIRFSISEETQKAMERYWQLKGKCSVSELFSTCLDFFLSQKDPQRQEVKPRSNKTRALFPEKVEPPTRYIPAEVKRDVWKRSKSQCEYMDPYTGRRCESRYRLEFDHIDPFCSGGASDEDNIRHLCRAHNLYFAGKIFQSEAELLSSGL